MSKGNYTSWAGPKKKTDAIDCTDEDAATGAPISAEMIAKGEAVWAKLGKTGLKIDEEDAAFDVGVDPIKGEDITAEQLLAGMGVGVQADHKLIGVDLAAGSDKAVYIWAMTGKEIQMDELAYKAPETLKALILEGKIVLKPPLLPPIPYNDLPMGALAHAEGLGGSKTLNWGKSPLEMPGGGLEISKPDEYECSVHGDIGQQTVYIWLDKLGDLPEIKRNYCYRCIVERLDILMGGEE